MGSKSKGKKRSIDFSSGLKMLSESMDQKFLTNTQHFTQALSSLRVRVEVLEDLLMEKFGETEDSLSERVLLRIEKMQGFVPVETPVEDGSIIRIKVKEELVGSESPDTPQENAFMIVGAKQINPSLDELLIGAVVGEIRNVTLPDPKDSTKSRKITATVCRVFKGNKVNETPAQEEAPKAAQG